MRGDLSPGLQAAQIAHAAFLYSVTFPEQTVRWHEASNYIVCLSVPSHEDLTLLSKTLDHQPHKVEVYEPDVDDELTCIAVGPEYEVRQLLGSLPLALREAVMR